MQPDKRNFLSAEDDGLLCRKSHGYTLDKLKALEEYLIRASKAMKSKPWRERYYIDLQAGPGKNSIAGQVYLGSPLIALTAKVPFTRYRFNELGKNGEFEALNQRVEASSLYDRVKLYQQDLNSVVHEICDEIEQRDRDFVKGAWPCLNVAFLDPEGLELHWATVERLAKMQRMDLIINFSTQGLNRLYGRIGEQGVLDIFDRFFGTDEWRNLEGLKSNEASIRRRAWINFYRKRLEPLGYYIQENPLWSGAEMVVKNSKNVQVYSMIFACKHELGDKFWKQSIKRAQGPKLPGFD